MSLPQLLSQCNHPDYDALMALYTSTNGIEWTNTINNDLPWDQSCDPCDGSWFGVACENGRVTDIFLSLNQLRGPLPDQLSTLKNLESLGLANNQISGTIPNFLFTLSKLERLILSDNLITGEIPTSINLLSNLQWLLLDRNLLSGEIPEQIGNLDSLISLFLYDNNFNGCVPLSLQNLCTIQVDIKDNPLLPWQGDFSRFCNGDNQIGAPCDDGDPLTDNDVIQADCSCKGLIINECRQRDSLALIALYNSTDGPNWTNKWDLSASMDSWYGIELNGDGCVTCIDMDGDIDCLNRSTITGNNLVGELPNELGNLVNIRNLTLSGNELIGIIPPQLGKLSNLGILRLNSNKLEGNIPNELGNLLDLTNLSLFDNNLTGNIPPQLGNLPNLQFLLLLQNQLTGSIPPELGNLRSLTNLNLFDNDITGNIPPQLGNLINLKRLVLSDNDFNGPLPASLGALSSIELIEIDENNFSGCIPESWINHCDITVELSSNPLLPWEGDFSKFCATDGSMQAQVGILCNDGNDSNGTNDVIQDDCSCGVVAMDCSQVNHPDYDALMALYTSTDGEGSWLIKDGWEDGAEGTSCDPCNYNGGTWYGISCSQGRVIEIALTSNNLEGLIPNEIGKLDSLKQIILESNFLIGRIPMEIGSLNNLYNLNFGNNNLSGRIPDVFNDFNKLNQFLIYNNDFDGPLPSSFCFENIRAISVHNNQLSGNLPDCIAASEKLEVLILHSNNFTGAIPEGVFGNETLNRIYLYNNKLNSCFPNNYNLKCGIGFNPINNADGYNFLGNGMLPFEGDLTKVCNGEEQIGAPCDDGNPLTENDIIQADCSCAGVDCDPSTCIDDGDCNNGFEEWNPATCQCDTIPSNQGCMDMIACNFNSSADCDDGSCSYDIVIEVITSICEGETYDLGAAGSFSNEVMKELFVIGDAPNGCDSIVELTLTIKPLILGSKLVNVCEGESTIVDGIPYTSGSYEIIIPNEDNNNCDSLVNLDVIELESNFISFDTLLCPGETYEFDGQVFDENFTSLEFIYQDQNGCDSIHLVEIEYEEITNPDCNPNVGFVETSVELVITPQDGAEFPNITDETESITIYGRWGNKVFEIQNPESNFIWYGNKENGSMLPEGTYYYFIVQGRGSDVSGGINKGFITLIN